MSRIGLFIVVFIFVRDPLFTLSCEERVNALIIIGDYNSAAETAASVLENRPDSKELWLNYIFALAKCGDEKKMMVAWRKFTSIFPDERLNRRGIESMAWGVIEKSAGSSHPLMRIYAAMSALFAEDALGVEILEKLLDDNNNIVRAAVLQMVSNLKDALLREKVLLTLRRERNYITRLEAIRATGKMGIKRAVPHLFKILEGCRGSLEEKMAAIEALTLILDDIKPDLLRKLVTSERAALRELACGFVVAFDKKESVGLILPLLRDHSHFVRQKALHALGIIKVKEYRGENIVNLIKSLAADCNKETAVAAGYALLNMDNFESAEPVFADALDNPNQKIRLIAGAALSATGRRGLPLIKRYFLQTNDNFVKMNLALALIGQEEEREAACDFLKERLINDREKWSWSSDSEFRFIRPSEVRHSPVFPNQPEMVNQLTRLEILNILAIMEHPGFEEAVKDFLAEKNWSISGMTAFLLLKEGDAGALEAIRKEMNSANANKRFQAALVLALWGREKDAIEILQSQYAAADYEMKQKILEGLCNIAAKESIPFLIERLAEQDQTLRIIAAASLLRCLNS